MKKVLLTAIGGSSAGTKPIANSILSAVLKAKGHEVVFFDTTFMDLGFPLDGEIQDRVLQFKPVDRSKYNLGRDMNIDARKEWLDLLDREKPDVIAASVMGDMYFYTMDFLRLAKQKMNIPVLVGGVHPTLLPDEVIAEDCVDAICIAEGEEAILEFLDGIQGTTITRKDIRNMWFKDDAGQVIKNQMRPLLELDRLPFMDYSIYDKRQFLRPFDGKFLWSGDMQDKRGCPLKCPYCANSVLNTTVYPKNRVNYYSPERFVEEAKYLTKTWKLEFFKNFSENVLVRPLDEFAKMAELYAKEVAIPFTVDTYPTTITEEKARLLKKMNCASVSVALESGSYHYRKHVLKRDYTNDLFVKKLQILKDAGLRVAVLNMMGLPYESRKMIFETIEVNRRAKPAVATLTTYFPYRGTPLGDLAVKEKFADPEVIKRRRFDLSRSIMNGPQIGPEEVNGIRRVGFFYLHYPKKLWPLIRVAEADTKLGNFVLEGLILAEKFRHLARSVARWPKRLRARFKGEAVSDMPLNTAVVGMAQ